MSAVEGYVFSQFTWGQSGPVPAVEVTLFNEEMGAATVVKASLVIDAPTDRIFELIADPAQQPRWDGNDNLAEAADGQRVHGVGEVFLTSLTLGTVRENHVVEFEEGRLIAWQPSEPGSTPPGHLWRGELTPVDATHTRVTHTYDWSKLTGEKRMVRARATGEDALMSSLTRLASTLGEGA